MLAAIFGVSGQVLTSEERAFFRDVQPLGFILFARNVADPDQVRRLVNDLRASVGHAEAPVLIDQEGGRVQRLKPPHWRAAPAAAKFGALRRSDASAGARGGVPQSPADRRRAARRSASTSTARRCSTCPAGRARRDRRPRLRHRSGAGRDARPRGSAGVYRSAGVAAGDQAHSRPWPRPRRQPSRAAARSTTSRAELATDRFRAVPARSTTCRGR